MKKKISLIALFFFATMLFSSCDLEQSKLTGTWYSYHGDRQTTRLSIYSGGSYNWTDHYYNPSWTNVMSGDWDYDSRSSTLVLTDSETGGTWTFYVQTLTDTRLVMINKYGDTFSFSRE